MNKRGEPNVGDPLGSLGASRLSPGLYELNQYRLGHPADLLSIVAPIAVAEPLKASGWDSPLEISIPKNPPAEPRRSAPALVLPGGFRPLRTPQPFGAPVRR